MKTRMMLLASAAPLRMPLPAIADTADKRIALSNNYAGNSWRQAMLTSWEKITGAAVAAGVVAAADAFTTAENQATEQAAQIQNMILQGYDAIVRQRRLADGAERRGQGGLRRRHHRRVLRRHRDRALRLAHRGRFQGNGPQDEVEYLAGKMPDGGNLLEIRGLAGVFVDDEISAGIHAGRRRRTRSSRSSARSTATGRRTWRRRRSPASCRACPTSSAW